MKATSVQNIKNVKDICVSATVFPAGGPGETLTIVIDTDDDVFEFNFEGQDLVQKCKKIGLFSGWEKEQKIRELEKELGEWKKEAADCLRLSVEAQKEAYKLKKGNEKLEKELESIRGYLITETKRLRKKCNADNKLQEESSTRADILDQAKKCVCGQREQDYGTPESNFQLIADLWNDYLGLCENGDGVPIFSIKSITPTDVAMMMALLKIARIKNGGGSGDSFVDLAGYAACGGEIWAEKRKSKDQK